MIGEKMIIEDDSVISKRKARELTNVLTNIKAYLKNPKAKYLDGVSSMKKWIALFIVMFLLMVCSNIVLDLEIAKDFKQREIITYCTNALIISFAVGIFIFLLFLNSWTKIYKKILKTEDKKNIIKFDNEKIVDEVVGDKVVTLYWNTLLCVRKFNEYVFFIQKDITGMFITIDSKHFDEIKNYIRENNINVNIVE